VHEECTPLVVTLRRAAAAAARLTKKRELGDWRRKRLWKRNGLWLFLPAPHSPVEGVDGCQHPPGERGAAARRRPATITAVREERPKMRTTSAAV
jgi:hypothetical protein